MNKGMSVAVGMLAGAALGAGAMTLSSSRSRRQIKSQAKKTINSMGNMVDDLSSMMKK